MSKIITFAFAALLSLGAIAQDPFVAGKDYAVIENPVRTANPDMIEVTEVFWYGCPHCNQFRPVFEQWKQQKADDVLVQHSPAMWNKRMATHAQVYYTAKALGKADVLHKDIFDAMHVNRKKMLRASEIFNVFEKHGVTREQFDKTFNSFGVRSMIQQADARARGYGINGTPEIVINGKYRTSASMVGSHERMLEVTNFLIAKERAAKAG